MRIRFEFCIYFFTTTPGCVSRYLISPVRLTLAFLDLTNLPQRLTPARLLGFWISDFAYDFGTMDERCIKCGVSIVLRRHNVQAAPEYIQELVREWIAPQLVLTTDNICETCWTFAHGSMQGSSRSGDDNSSNATDQNTRHRHSCINCGRSLLRSRSHQLRVDSEREQTIFNVINRWIQPQQVRPTGAICHPCWQRADRASSTRRRPFTENIRNVENRDQPNRALSTEVILPDYCRAVDTQAHCFVNACHRIERFCVPLALRRLLLKKYYYYVPFNSRVCSQHVSQTMWDFLNVAPHNIIKSFSAAHIQDMMSLIKNSEVVDFENINEMPDHLVQYWLGRTKTQFNAIAEELPRLSQMRKGRIALTAFLIKIRTGDSYERLSSLMLTPKRTLVSIISKVRGILLEDYVPLHVGLNHLTREQIAMRNLMIPNGLFGNQDRTQPIVIVDGTYIYVQKSSNYNFQKSSYSLHKYRNLVKMFLIVTTDGYIVEVLGPYPATKSDAEITRKEFSHENQPLRRYFQAGDVFVLDRGFKDALPLLNECGYRVHKPENVRQGETQLTTLDANKSRAVTICRWVVEVVNGRFKRDFKIFRQEYYNAASKNLYKDFYIAAALINAFHPVINDRDDARDILHIMRQKMFTSNTLAIDVTNNNLNRRSSDFLSIQINDNNVNDFPRLSYSELMSISLGTYQIKQACSYYGEHIRESGTYIIEVCREVAGSQLLRLSSNQWLLRGKIKSRHVRRKVYYVYIIIDNTQNGREGIIQHYCNCIVGKRTVGCCAHIMTIIWYLGWARYQENIRPPAQHLDNILNA